MPNWKKVIVSGSDARINSLFTAGHVTASGNVSGSYESTASFGRVQATVIGGNSPLKIEADNFNVSSDGTVSGSSTSTGSFGSLVVADKVQGSLRVTSGASGVATTDRTDGDDLVVENSNHGGISILTPDDKFSTINFGSPSDNRGAVLDYSHSTKVLNIGTDIATGKVIFKTAAGTTNMTLDASGNLGIGKTPTEKLDVSGNILANNVTTNSNGTGSFAMVRLTTGNISGSSTSTGSFGVAKVAGKDIKPNGVARDQVLKWNGNQFVPAAYDATFEFTIADFDMNFSSSPQLIGAGIWKAINALTFTATYNNGPPDGWNGSAEGAPKIQTFVASSASGSAMYPLSSSFASGTNNIAIAYPPNTGNDIRFRLYASAGSDVDNDYTDQRIYFRNHFVYGSSTKNDSFSQTDVANLASSNAIVTNDTSRTITVSIGNTDYLVFAHRTGDTNVNQVRCGTGNNVLTVAMDRTDATTITPLKETVSYTNTAGKVENFYVYASKLQNIDAHSTSFTTVTSTQKKNYIYWGTESSWTNNETAVEALTNKNSSLDDGSITGNTLSVGNFTSKYVIVAIPARYGDNDTNYQFKDNSTNLPFSFNQQSDVTITNAVGFQEDYSVYRSTNQLTMTNATVLIATV